MIKKFTKFILKLFEPKTAQEENKKRKNAIRLTALKACELLQEKIEQATRFNFSHSGAVLVQTTHPDLRSLTETLEVIYQYVKSDRLIPTPYIKDQLNTINLNQYLIGSDGKYLTTKDISDFCSISQQLCDELGKCEAAEYGVPETNLRSVQPVLIAIKNTANSLQEVC